MPAGGVLNPQRNWAAARCAPGSPDEHRPSPVSLGSEPAEMGCGTRRGSVGETESLTLGSVTPG